MGIRHREVNNTRSQGWRLRNVCLAVTLGALFGLALLPAPNSSAQGLPLIRDTEIERLLNDYSRPIFDAAGLGGGRVAIRIVRSRIYNAFVVDGRNVFIHTGAIMQSDTPNQIIGVIAHEAGHIAGGDLATSENARRLSPPRHLLSPPSPLISQAARSDERSGEALNSVRILRSVAPI